MDVCAWIICMDCSLYKGVYKGISSTTLQFCTFNMFAHLLLSVLPCQHVCLIKVDCWSPVREFHDNLASLFEKNTRTLIYIVFDARHSLLISVTHFEAFSLIWETISAYLHAKTSDIFDSDKI